VWSAVLPGMRKTSTSRSGRPEPLAAKVPEITALFWVIKILTTGMGEAISDFLGQISVPMAGFVGIAGVTVAMRLQLRAREYRAVVYWSAVMMVAVFGTMVSDGLRDGAGISYAVATVFFSLTTAIVFALWYRSEGTLSIHSITTRRRETYYWSAVLSTFALGTASGDLTALSLNIGFFGSALLFTGIIAVPGLLWWRGGLSPIVAFWAAYIVTRPLGASFADGFSKPHAITGLGLGDGPVSGLLLVGFVALVVYTAVTKRDIQPRPEGWHPHLPHPHLPSAGVVAQPAEG
jgi:uncharacterized membrane-anchored protein